MLISGSDGDVSLLGGSGDWTEGGSTTVSGVFCSVCTNHVGIDELLVEDMLCVTMLQVALL